MLNPAARLEWKSFFAAGNAMAKRLGTEDGKAAQIMLLEIIKINQQCNPNHNSVPAPGFETIFI